MHTRPRYVPTTLLTALMIALGCAPPTEEDPRSTGAEELVQSTASLATARFQHTTLKLANGKVLVAGGSGPSGKIASAEIYDPATNGWTATGSMLTARADGASALLPDGTVLVMGGVGVTDILSSAERFNPATGTWSALPPMSHAAWDQTATRLLDGRVLVTGGCPSPYSAVAEIFDPSTGTWSPTGSMTLPRCAHRATLLADGRVLITGGTYQQFDSNRAEIYDPATGTFSAVASANTPKQPHQAVRLADGRVLLLANWSTTGNEIYDPATNTWSTAPMPRDQRSDQVAVPLSDGSILVMGGEPSSIERFANGAWSVVGHTIGTRNEPGVAVLDDGRVMLAGGQRIAWQPCGSGCWTGSPSPVATTELYTHDLTKLSTWSSTLGVPACLSVQNECDSLDFLYGRASIQPEAHQPNTINGSCADGASGSSSDETIQALRIRSSNGGPMQGGSQVIVQATVNASIASPSTDMLDLYRAADANNPVWQLVATLPLDLPKSGLHDLSTTFTLPPGSLQAVRAGFRRGGTASPCSAGPTDDHDDLVFAVAPAPPDTTPPSVSITAPTNGSTVSGTVAVSASASDNSGIARVDFFVGGTLIGSDSTFPYGVSWSTAGWNGSQSLSATAYDLANNATTSSPVSVTVSNGSSNVASYDSLLRTGSCRSTGLSCDSSTLFNGRAQLGPELNAPNTVNASCADGTGGVYHSDESLDRLRVYATTAGTTMQAGRSVTVEATVWAWSGYTADQLDLYYAADANNPSWVFLATITPSGAGVRTLTATYTLPAGALQAIRGQFRYGSGAGPCTSGVFNDRDDLAFAVAP